MPSKVIGREAELAILQEFLSTDYPEFLVIYGRQRVGKTFLIRRFISDKSSSDHFYMPIRKVHVMPLESLGRMLQAP